MAAARSYRDELQRPHCGSNRLPKDGRSRGKQICGCRFCHYRFMPDGNRHYYPEQAKEQAIDLYGEGIGRGHHQPGFGGQAGCRVRMGQKSPVGVGHLGLGDDAAPAVGHSTGQIF